MRTMMTVKIPVEAGNKGIIEGTLPRVIEGFAKAYKPEAAYFTSDGGDRAGFFFFDLPDASHLPSIAEPFFIQLGAQVSFQPVMNDQDLRAGLERYMSTKH